MTKLATIALAALLLTGCMGNTNGGGYNPALYQALANIGTQWQGRMQHQQMLNLQQQLYNQRQRQQSIRLQTQCFNLGGVIQCQ